MVGVRRRDPDEGQEPFLQRSVQWWRAHRPYTNNPEAYRQFLTFGAAVLAGMGELRGDEVARLERIAAGVKGHPKVDADQAATILAR